MSTGLVFEQIGSHEWSVFQKTSPQCSVFSSVEFLELLGFEITYFLIRKGTEKIAAFPALHRGFKMEIPPFSLSAGIHYSSFKNLKEGSRNDLRHKINEVLAQELFCRYEKITFGNHPTVIDLRAFDWYNHSTKSESGGYNLQVRYTSYLRIVDGNEQLAYSQLRRRDLKTSALVSAKVEFSNSVSELNRLHEMTFVRQGLHRSEAEIRCLVSIASRMLASQNGELYLCKVDGQVVSACFWLIGKGIAHYLFGANDPTFREAGTGTLCIHHSIQDIWKKHKIDLFDFVGINSPNRGSFKLSFGGFIVPYFEVSKMRKNDTK